MTIAHTFQNETHSGINLHALGFDDAPKPPVKEPPFPPNEPPIQEPDPPPEGPFPPQGPPAEVPPDAPQESPVREPPPEDPNRKPYDPPERRVSIRPIAGQRYTFRALFEHGIGSNRSALDKPSHKEVGHA